MEGDGIKEAGSSSAIQGGGARACDNCRARKIRCDRASPCSNCRAAQAICRTTPRFKEQRQRVLISHQYEKRIESIDERLTGIEDLLRDLAVSLPHSQGSQKGATSWENVSQPHDKNLLAASSQENAATEESTPEFEGESALSAHSVHASKIFEKAMGSSPHFENNPEIIEALNSLKETVRKQSLPSAIHVLRFTGQPTRSPIDLSKLKMPPAKDVLDLLRSGKDVYPDFFLTLPVTDLEHFTQMCKDVYFCTEEYSPSHFAVVCCLLGYLFGEQSLSQEDVEVRAKFSGYYTICMSNFETIMDSFNLFMEPNFTNALALMLGAFHAAQNSKMSLSWNFTCAAARMCQSLGYHRSVAGKADKKEDVERKKGLFWFVYIMDKDFSLCFGRNPTMQDYDVAVEYPDFPDDPRFRPWYQVFHSWIKCAAMGGKIYKHLYSVRALTGDSEIRTKKAYELADALWKWREEALQVEISGAIHARFLEFLLPGVDMGYYLFLTLIYRVIPPTQPPETPSGLSRGCVDAARKSMQIHQQFADAVKDRDSYMWKGYIDWTVLHCPFAPFMVIFCHTITATSLDDLKLLESVAESLRTVGSVSEAANRLYRLFSVFYQVAKAYVDAQLKEFERACADTETYPQFGAEFDPFLNALGMAPPLAGPPMRGMDQAAPAADLAPGQQPADLEMGQTLEGWFLGNQYMMGLLESDLSPAHLR